MRRIALFIFLLCCCNISYAQSVVKLCKTCNKPISRCEYKGNHNQRITQNQTTTTTSASTAKTKSGRTIQITKEVDLGLPSGTIWAGWNIGANNASGYGKYYSWGEITTKKIYDFKNYFDYKDKTRFCDECIEYGYEKGKKHSIIGTTRDVATQQWGAQWNMPSADQWDELIKCCSFKKDKYDKISGLVITGPNGKSMFLPASGAYQDGEDWIRDRNLQGDYWVGNLVNYHAYNIEFGLWNDDVKPYQQPRERYYGHTVRAVKRK